MLQVSNRVVADVPPNFPELCAPASEQGTEVIGINQDPAVHRKSDQLLWRVGGIERKPQRWVTLHLMAEMIQGIQ